MPAADGPQDVIKKPQAEPQPSGQQELHRLEKNRQFHGRQPNRRERKLPDGRRSSS